jgi:hypothetical protein
MSRELTIKIMAKLDGDLPLQVNLGVGLLIERGHLPADQQEAASATALAFWENQPEGAYDELLRETGQAYTGNSQTAAYPLGIDPIAALRNKII